MPQEGAFLLAKSIILCYIKKYNERIRNIQITLLYH